MASIQGQFSINGLHPTGLEITGVWMRDCAAVQFLFDETIESVFVSGTVEPYASRFHSRFCERPLSLELKMGKRYSETFTFPKKGDFCFELKTFPLKKNERSENKRIEFRLLGVGFTNFLAFMGRLLEKQCWLPRGVRDWLQPYRRQHTNRQILIRQIQVNHEVMIDFDQAHSIFESKFIVNHSHVGMNIVGWFHGYLGVGESARACSRAARAAGFVVDSVGLKLNLNGGQSEALWPDPLAVGGRQGITVAHVDAPQSFDLTTQHPIEMDRSKYRIGYWAWELPDFPDGWIQYASQFDEIWCPSEFCRDAMAPKLPVPVMVMPHSINMPEVEQNSSFWRNRFQLPEDSFLFLFTFDFNSYAPRKNPEAVIEAYRKAFVVDGAELNASVGLVLKMHGKGYAEEERKKLDELKHDIPGLYIVDETLDRDELTGLQMSCDCFVSLHRSEGFGLAVAEMMALGKPVISTDWSATSEFVNEQTGCPVKSRLVTLSRNIGPYTKGQKWAEPSVEDAAKWMVKMAADPDAAKKLGAAAKVFIEREYSPLKIGQRYLSRVKAIALFRHP